MDMVILASGRSEGNTRQIFEAVFQGRRYSLVDTSTTLISPFAYGNYPQDDGFIDSVERFLTGSGLLVIASPVYWNGLSAQAKAYIDRFADLLTERRDLALKLHDRRVALLCCGSRPESPADIAAPVETLCVHIRMNFVGSWYVHCPETAVPSDIADRAISIADALFGAECANP